MPQPRIEIRRHSPDCPWTYAELDRRQREVAEEIRSSGGPGAVLLSEVAPVITLGRRANWEKELRAPRERYEERGIALLPVDRGGLGTYHGPGQWVLFVVDRLDRLTGDSRGVRQAVQGLLEVGRLSANAHDPDASLREGAETGIWGRRGKIASVGVQIRDGVLLHGLCVNGYPTPQSFFGLRPCGLEGAPLQFLLDGLPAGLEREQAFEALGKRLLDAVSEVFYRNPPGNRVDRAVGSGYIRSIPNRDVGS